MRTKDWFFVILSAILLTIGVTAGLLPWIMPTRPAEGQLIPAPSQIRRLIDGTAAAPAIAWKNAPTTGFRQSSGSIVVVLSGIDQYSFNTTEFVGPGPIRLGGITFASLGTPTNGSIQFCTDCTIANPCAALGTGAFAKRLNGVWVCN